MDEFRLFGASKITISVLPGKAPDMVVITERAYVSSHNNLPAEG